jgi:hypothetical protein
MREALSILHRKTTTPRKLFLAGVLIFVVCLLPTVQTYAVDSKNWNIYCITAGDCALYDPTTCSAVTDTIEGTNNTVGSIIPDDQIPGASRKEKEWNYLISLGLTPVQVAGIMGNIAHEGVFDPESVEDIPGLPARSKDPYAAGDYGWGLFGFTPGYYVFGKTQESYWYASNKAANIQPTKDNIYYISTQMDIEYAYMQYNKGTSGKSLLDEYKARATSPSAAAAAWMELAEKPLHPNYGPREHSAIVLMNKFGKNGTSTVDTSSSGSGSSSASTCCNTSSDPATAGLPTTGDTQVLAKQILNNPNITFDLGPDGKVADNFKRMAQDEEAQTDAGRNVDVQPIILVALLYLAKDHKVQVSSLTDGSSHLAKDNPHGMGDAMDIDMFDGQPTNGSDEVANKIINVLEQVLPSGSRFGMGDHPFSGTQTVDGKDFTAFTDNPNHVHFDVVGVPQEEDDKAVKTAGEGASAVASTETQSSQCCADGSTASGDSSLTGKTNAEKAFNYFIGKGLSAQAAAGIVGNMMTESAGNTENLDTHAHNDLYGTHDGIVQWSTSLLV